MGDRRAACRRHRGRTSWSASADHGVRLPPSRVAVRAAVAAELLERAATVAVAAAVGGVAVGAGGVLSVCGVVGRRPPLLTGGGVLITAFMPVDRLDAGLLIPYGSAAAAVAPTGVLPAGACGGARSK